MLRFHRAGTALVLVILAACGEHGTSSTEPLAAADAQHSVADQGFLYCPTDQPRSATGVIGIDGGTIAVDGHRLTLPPGAVLGPTQFSVTAPASDYVELEVHAEGQDSFVFLVPAEITISYERCGDRAVDPESLAVWHIDELTGVLLEFMGGLADEENRSISFTTSHLSGFIIVN